MVSATLASLVAPYLPILQEYWPIVLTVLACLGAAGVLIRTSLASPGDETLPPEQTLEYSDLDGLDDEEDEYAPSLPSDLEHVPFVFERITQTESLEKSKQFYEEMDKRRTVRFFSSDPIDIEVIRNIIKAAGTAPSGAHTEPWTYVVVSDQEIKLKVRDIVEQEEMINYERRMGKRWTTDLEPLKTSWQKEYLTTAPYLIFVFKQVYGVKEDGTRKEHYYNEISVAIAAGILITAIHNAGLVCLTSTPLNCGPALRSLLQRPTNEKLTLLLPVGYPSADATVPDLQRKPLDQILVEI